MQNPYHVAKELAFLLAFSRKRSAAPFRQLAEGFGMNNGKMFQVGNNFLS